MAFWPALLLAREDAAVGLCGGLLAGGAVLLAEVALLSQSRGSLYATPVMLVLVFVLLPGRTRTFATARAGRPRHRARPPRWCCTSATESTTATMRPAALHTAVVATVRGGGGGRPVVALGAAIEADERSPRPRPADKRGVGAIAIATLVGSLAAAAGRAGDPVTRARHGWDTFKAGYGAEQLHRQSPDQRAGQQPL